MKTYIALISLIFFTSCSVQTDKDVKQVDQKATCLVTGLKGLEMEADFCEKTTFLNGNEIKQAQLSSEWKKACKNEDPAWCYADSKTKQGILYNFYAFSDKRGIVSKAKILNRVEVEIIQKELESNSKRIKFNWFKGSSIERSFNGNNYDLKFVNFWFKDDSNSKEKVSAAALDQKNNKLKVESVSSNNGYRIWLKK